MIRQIKYRPIEPLNLGVGKDTVGDFGRKYNHEVAHIYDILNSLVVEDVNVPTVEVDSKLNRDSNNLVENQAVAKAIIDLTKKEEQDISQTAPRVHTHTTDEIEGFPKSLPAKDVYEWAKQKNKPTYCWNEIQCKPAILCGFMADDKLLPVIDGIVQFDLGKLVDVTVPTALSGFTNDMGFISETAIDNKLSVKADKSNTYTKAEINNLVTEVTEAEILAIFEV